MPRGKSMSPRKSIKNMSTRKSTLPLTAHCMKCKTQVTIIDPKVFTATNGRKMTRGFCSKCDGKVCTTAV